MKKLLLFMATTVALCAAPRLAKAQTFNCITTSGAIFTAKMPLLDLVSPPR
ncbi:hypothetical protein POREN0001_0255 [Porphyromonas endodontalis ATCC 35406]|uniref:Uncharacterized protein n=1 Tax=Porphyromonas endodontalis (strain ATCC 35406 / DSM 24491 / JCM 8526 / CCUG 16442 / BCRC 14492 / NCTC 13058 / HG 370) TaxID=553175 RepID=C3JAL8_POREA|nr:hypothetical protein POREN0001_0255 [Porphyromonas endodontalis ATCC 35406]